MFRKSLNITAFCLFLLSAVVLWFEVSPRLSTGRIPSSVAAKEAVEAQSPEALLEKIPRAKLISYVSALWQELLEKTKYRFEYRDSADHEAKKSELRSLVSAALRNEYQGAPSLLGKGKLELEGKRYLVQAKILFAEESVKRDALKRGYAEDFRPSVRYEIEEASPDRSLFVQEDGSKHADELFFPQGKQIFYITWTSRALNMSGRYPKIALQMKFFNRSFADIEVLDIVSGKWLHFKDALEWSGDQ